MKTQCSQKKKNVAVELLLCVQAFVSMSASGCWVLEGRLEVTLHL